MDKLLSILLVEDEPLECNAIVKYIESRDDVCLVGATNDSSKALEYVTDFMPDAVILDLELHKGCGNGLVFLRLLQEENMPFHPYVLVTTNNISPATHENARQWGADFIMVKSQKDYSAESVVEFLRLLKNQLHESSRAKKIPAPANTADTQNQIYKRMLTKTAAYIDRVGISPKATGRKYLIDGIILAVNNSNVNICATIAQKYQKSDASVERAMQNAINAAWRTSNIEDLEKYYTAYVNPSRGVPTLVEFIYHYAEKIKNEY